jgi:orotidine-5'-phosphate decarboxylase
MKFENVKDRIIVALDFDSEEKALSLVKEIKDKVGVFKVGKELFTACGPDIIKKINEMGGKVFLDLKFHDIPNTVAKAVSAATKHGVYMMTLHTLGGSEMLEKAAETAKETSKKLSIPKPILLGVSILTSHNAQSIHEIGLNGEVEDNVKNLVKMAEKSGINAIVCSPKEVEMLRREFGQDLILVTPGIRPKWAASNDQKRISTPSDAIKSGSTFIVIGRPISASENPKEACDKIIDELENGND